MRIPYGDVTGAVVEFISTNAKAATAEIEDDRLFFSALTCTRLGQATQILLLLHCAAGHNEIFGLLWLNMVEILFC
jgi:hypothetical protein